jgi:hypothetical protein
VVWNVYFGSISGPYLSKVIHERNNKHHYNFEANPNPLLQPLLIFIVGPVAQFI